MQSYFDPNRLVFTKLNALLRITAARTVPDLWDTIRQTFSRFAPPECRSHLAAAGYNVYSDVNT